jgi:cubilin
LWQAYNTVTLSFSQFNTEQDYDGVLIYDDFSGTNQLAALTGTSIPSSVSSTTGKMLVIFVSDYSTTLQGFTANYTSTGSAFCSGVTNINATDSGTLSDGSASNSYCNNLDCQWLIQPPQATTVTLNFTEFDIEAASSDGQTIYDAVEVYDGTTTSAALLGRFTGSNLPPAVTSTGGSLLVRFYSDLEEVKQGWSASYTSTQSSYCSGTTSLTAESGTFNDGSGTNLYSNNNICSWLIQPTNANTNSITLSFSAFKTELDYDGVIVYDGVNNTSPVLGQFSGTTIPASVTSTGGSMYVEFISDPAVRADGWIANYTSTIVTGINEALIKQNLKIFPNPTEGIFTITSDFESSGSLQILDILGKQVLRTYDINKGENEIDASELTKGIYLLKIKIGDGYHSERLILN